MIPTNETPAFQGKADIALQSVDRVSELIRNGAGKAIINEMPGALFADGRLQLRRFLPDVKHKYAFMTSMDAPMTRVTRKFYEYCVERFDHQSDWFRLPH